MSRKDELERAIELAHTERPDPLRCVECDVSVVTVEWREELHDWVPQDWHRAETMETACPVLSGGLAAQRRWLDVQHALAPYIFLAHYGEPVDIGVVNAELAAL